MKAEGNNEMIQEFLDGKLRGERLKEFEKEMKKNPELEREIRSLQEIELGLRSAGVDRLKSKVNAWENEYQNSLRKDKRKVRSLRTYFSIAASVVVLVATGIYIFSSRTQDYQTLYADNFIPYEDMVLSRGEGENDLNMALSEGMTAYNDHQYELTVQKLSSYLSQNPEHYGVALYIGIAQMELDDFSSALASLEIARKDPMFAQQAQWYQALLYIKSEQIDQAKVDLQKIALQERHYKKDEAKELLDQLE